MDISTCCGASFSVDKKRVGRAAALLRIRASPFCSQVLARGTHAPFPYTTPLPFFPSFFSFFPSFFSFFPFPSPLPSFSPFYPFLPLTLTTFTLLPSHEHPYPCPLLSSFSPSSPLLGHMSLGAKKA